MRQYSADQISVTFFGLDLTPGLASGTFVQIVRNTAAWRLVPDGLGDAARVFSADRSARVTLSIDGESRAHLELVTLANADRLARGIVGPLVILDANTREGFVLHNAFIEDLPEIGKASTSAIYQWTFHGQAALQQPVGFNANQIGA